MKLIKYIAYTFSFLILSVTVTQAQNEALQRDMRIAESILSEIFSSETQPTLPSIFGRSNHISSDYIPGYGVHISIGEMQSGISVNVVRLSGSIRIDREGSEEEELESKSTGEAVEKKIMEYITQYASSMQNLPKGENLRLSYGLKKSAVGSIAVITGLQEYKMEIPKLSFVVKSEDLNLHREGQISDNQLASRVQRSDLSKIEEKRDLNIFASILETTLKDSGSEQLRVNRKPTFDYLPGLGVFYDVNVRSSAGYSISALASDIDKMNLANVHIRMDLGDITDGFDRDFQMSTPKIQIERDSLRIQVQRMGDSLRKDLEGLKLGFVDTRADSVNPQIYSMAGRRLDFNFAERDTIDLSNDAAKLTDEMVEVLKDYGYTLSSLESDEILMITINWQGRNPSLPEKTIIRTTREDLFFGREPVVEEISRR